MSSGKKMAKSRNLPGVTKSLMWVRLGGVEGNQENGIELLDSPGIIPARQLDQEGDSRLHPDIISCCSKIKRTVSYARIKIIIRNYWLCPNWSPSSVAGLDTACSCCEQFLFRH
jgi:ribosome biogenesis GTPase A